MKEITWTEFDVVELRTGTILNVEEFPQARTPAYKITVDFGPEIGIRKSSAQVTGLYQPEQLLGRQIVGVVNFPPKQIGPMRSECLITGFYRDDGNVVLATPEREVPNGAKLG
jgi:tRNA-binding protein